MHRMHRAAAHSGRGMFRSDKAILSPHPILCRILLKRHYSEPAARHILSDSSQRTGVYSITASLSVASSLKMTGRKPSLQLHIATPGLRIQSP